LNYARINARDCSGRCKELGAAAAFSRKRRVAWSIIPWHGEGWKKRLSPALRHPLSCSTYPWLEH